MPQTFVNVNAKTDWKNQLICKKWTNNISLPDLSGYLCLYSSCLYAEHMCSCKRLPFAGSPGCSIVSLFDRLSPCRNVCIVKKMVLVITSICVTLFQTSQTWEMWPRVHISIQGKSLQGIFLGFILSGYILSGYILSAYILRSCQGTSDLVMSTLQSVFSYLTLHYGSDHSIKGF